MLNFDSDIQAVANIAAKYLFSGLLDLSYMRLYQEMNFFFPTLNVPDVNEL